MPCAAGEVGDQRLRLVQVPVEDRHVLEARADEHRNGRPGATACSEDHRNARPAALGARQDSRHASPDTFHVGVVAAQAARVADDHVDRATQPRVLGEAAYEGARLLLVRCNHQRAKVLVSPQFGDRLAQQMRARLPVLDHHRKARRVEPCAQHRLGRSGLTSGADDG